MLKKIFIKSIKNNCSFFSIWSHVPASPLDPILGVNQNFKAEKNPAK
jgi:hypothetical protein